MAPTATQILSTPRARAHEILGRDPAAARKAFRELVKRFHPDRNPGPDAAGVVQHLTLLRDAIVDRGAGRGTYDSTRDFKTVDGSIWRYRHLRSRRFDAGEILVGRNSLVHLVEPEFADLLAAEPELGFADGRMRKGMELLLPIRRRRVETEKGTVLVHRRTPDQVLLTDLVAGIGDRPDPRHVAWMVSAMLNLACYLEWAGLAHGDIGPDSLLVSTKYHSIALTGPLLYATRFGMRPKALPTRTLDVVPRLGLDGGTVDPTVDLALVRRTALEILGDVAGSRLLRDTGFPRPFAMWLLTPPAATAQADYAAWERAREASFGPQRFVEMGIDVEALYA